MDCGKRAIGPRHSAVRRAAQALGGSGDGGGKMGGKVGEGGGGDEIDGGERRGALAVV